MVKYSMLTPTCTQIYLYHLPSVDLRMEMYPRSALLDLIIQSSPCVVVSEYRDPVVDVFDPVAYQGDIYKNKHMEAWKIYFAGSYWRPGTLILLIISEMKLILAECVDECVNK